MKRLPRILIILFQSILLVNTSLSAQDEYNVIKGNWLEYSDASNSFYNYLTSQAYKMLDQREERISELKTSDDWQQRQKFIRETLIDITGPFPGKTPLNAKIVRVLEKPGFRVEHIIYESIPGFYVTSSLYIPAGLKRNSKAPAVIYCSGHSVDGYRSVVYQHVILNLVRKGFVVFAFDPVGQGERLEYFDPKTGKSVVGGPTSEHSYPGAQAFLTGSSQAFYMIWDGIRAVDYLLTRKEVDPERIGITGRSGGGTQSAYIAAFDDRIYAAAPENYITNYRRLLQTIGPQDAEQNLFNLISSGLDHPDFLIVRAPKPALMITTTRDMFSIQGAEETEKEVSKAYRAFGKEENFSRVEDDSTHASTVKNREAMYAFFQKHLRNPGNYKDEEIQMLSPDEMRVTEKGQVSESLKGATVFSLNRLIAEDLDKKLNSARNYPDVFLPEVISDSKKISGYIEPSAIDEPVFSGRIRKYKYYIEKYFLKGEGDYVIPYLLFRPVNPGNKYMLYLHPLGKSAEASAGGEIERFVRQGITVLAPDLPGIGELGSGLLRGDAWFGGVSHNLWYASMLIGRSITGIQAGDVSRLVKVIRQSSPEAEIIGFARKELSPVLLHSAAGTEDLATIILVEPYISWLSIALTQYYTPGFIMSGVPGALQKYDLPDLASALAPRELFIVAPTGGNSDSNDTLNINNGLNLIIAAYKRANAGSSLKIITGTSPDNINNQLIDWMKYN